MLSGPQELPVDLTVVDTSKGSWGIFVQTVVETQAGHNLLVRIILEQSIDDERFRMRRLEIAVSADDARDPDRVPHIANRIRDWIQSTEGDGFIDMIDTPN